jgi:hypothetical protein
VSICKSSTERTSVPNAEIPEPVGGDRERHALGTNVEGEDLAGDDPRDGPPRSGEKRDVEAHERDENALGGDVDGFVCVDVTSRDTDNGDDVLAEHHASSANKQKPATSDAIDHVNADGGHDGIDDVRDDGDDEGVLDTGTGEESRAVLCKSGFSVKWVG